MKKSAQNKTAAELKQQLDRLTDEEVKAYRSAVLASTDLIIRTIRLTAKEVGMPTEILENALFNTFLSVAATNAKHQEKDVLEYISHRFSDFVEHYKSGQVSVINDDEEDEPSSAQDPSSAEIDASQDPNTSQSPSGAVLGAIGHTRRHTTDA